MYKLFLLAVSIGGFVFAGSWDNTPKSVETSDKNNNQYYNPFFTRKNYRGI